MKSRRRIDTIGMPILLGSTLTAVVLGLVLIWFEIRSMVLIKLFSSAIAFALASGYVLSASRVVAGERRRDV